MNKITFENLIEKYGKREPVFPKNWPKPNEFDLNFLIQKYNCKFSKSFIDFQLKYCHLVPMGYFSFEGFGWANNSLDSYLSLEEILKDYNQLEFPDSLTPFRYENGDYWCFDNRNSNIEFPVVIFDHNSFDIEKNPEYKWINFIDWIDKTMDS